MFVPLSLLALGASAAPQELSIPNQKFTLENGLQVVVHEDHSDPVVAVYVYYHVGSAREEPKRSGFAHLFEHMLFQGSQHVGDDQHFKLVQGAGGTLNGSTNTDRTNYFETLPANQLELALWLESDRMGFLLPAITQAKLDNQRDVVKNERRQNYENRPYGQSEGAICAALYPPDHPYSWITIGSQEDLSAATLDDVKNFFSRWYGPNNATLAIGGDVKFDDVKRLVERYFGSLPVGPDVAVPAPRPTKLEQSKRLVIEDKIKLPQLELVWPTVQSYHADDAALDMLASILAANKTAVLDKALTIDQELASEVSAQQDSQELAGTFRITLRVKPGVTLDTLEQKTRALLAKLAQDGVDAQALERVKTVYESRFVRRLETVGTRTNQLAAANCMTGDPEYHKKIVAAHLAVTPADVNRVLKQYVIDRPSLALSTVPKGKKELAASPLAAEITSREKPLNLEVAAPPVREAPKFAAAQAPADLDRTKKPSASAPIAFRSPNVWHDKLENGISVTGSKWSELPLTTVSISVPAGRRFESRAQLGLASITARMLNEGTQKLSTIAMQQELDRLGASLNVGVDEDEMSFSVSCLDKHLDAALALLGDVILTPRFAPEDFARVKSETLVSIDTRGDSVPRVASYVFKKLLFGAGRVQGSPASGTRDTVSKLTVDDVRRFWKEHVTPQGGRLVHVGGRDAAGVKSLCAPLVKSWRSSGTVAASARKADAPVATWKTRVYLVDKPGAAQSEIRIGHMGLAASDADQYPLEVLNYVLGGSFSSRINLNLREAHGYTYGARSAFELSLDPGAFVASAGVKTDVTKESVVEFMKELNAIRDGLRDEEMTFAQESLTQAATRQYESTGALLGYLSNVSLYGWPDDFAACRLRELAKMKASDTKPLAQKWIHPDRMLIVVVGDKAKILPGLNELGYGEVVELDIDGNPMEAVAAAPAAGAAAGSAR